MSDLTVGAFPVVVTGSAASNVISFPFDVALVAVSAALGTVGSTASTVDVQKNGATVLTGANNAVSAKVQVAISAKCSPVVSSALGVAHGASGEVTNNVTSGINIINPNVKDASDLATLVAATDTIATTAWSLGTSAANPTVTLWFRKV